MQITEARIAITISCAAVIFSAWQAYEAKSANSLNRESIQLEVKPSDSPSQRQGEVTCIQNGHSLITLNWKVTIFNSSAQPVTIKDIFAMGYSDAGQAASVGPISKDGPVNRTFPETIPSKGFKVVALRVPAPFASTLKPAYGCGTSVSQPSSGANTAIPDSSNGIYVKVTTGDGNEFSKISTWQ